MSQHDLPSVDYEKLKHQDWSCLIVAQVFVDADRASVQRFKIKSRFQDQGTFNWSSLILYLNTVNEEVMNASCLDACDFCS